ncbi:class I SAM-dependent methyltransferase [Glutamicibacter sp. MNS18]|uniref:class I SAM-dependent DNA methyltransferase n=1 Tax=Glutamicibacter sp. MNS18 TaxID=2989817 RepID=UPI002236B0CD|nr:class I SAM-dependent methyltransferase [Glutamicibacter sp. MNS18]MCW4464876.1 class I SAM-dependent methyltransferase [Glutamicibacter sp. MNS18]
MSDHHVRMAYGSRAAEYISLLGNQEQMHHQDRRLILGWGEQVAGPVIDAGCGPGHWTELLRQQGLDITGIDIVAEFVASANRRFPETTYRLSSLRSLGVPDGSLAGVLAWYSLIHIHPSDMPLVIAEFARAIKTGGRVLLGFFEGDSPRSFDHAVITGFYWPIEEMKRLLEQAGFQVEGIDRRHDPGSRSHAAISCILR